jgi:hypothetical protein
MNAIQNSDLHGFLPPIDYNALLPRSKEWKTRDFGTKD